MQYADDTQILVSGKKSEFNNVVCRMERVLTSLDIWFRANGLKVNADKTPLMLLESAQNLRNASNFTVEFRAVCGQYLPVIPMTPTQMKLGPFRRYLVVQPEPMLAGVDQM